MISATFTPFVWREPVNVGLDSKVMAFNVKKVSPFQNLKCIFQEEDPHFTARSVLPFPPDKDF